MESAELIELIWNFTLYCFAALGYLAVGVWVLGIAKERKWEVTFGTDMDGVFLWPIALIWGGFLAPFILALHDWFRRSKDKP